MAQDNSIPLQAFQGQSPVDNFLSSYSASQQQAQGNEMHKRKIGALDQADEERKRQLVADALIAVPDGDAAAFEQVKQGLVSQGVIDAQTASQYDVSRLGQLKMMSQKWREMKQFEMNQAKGTADLRLTDAQIAAQKANAAQSYSSARAADALANFRTAGGGMRGGGMTGRPMSAGVQGKEDEDIGDIQSIQSVNTQIDNVLGNLKSGDLELGPFANLGSRALNFAGTSTAGSRNFAEFEATLEKMRNDSLRLNKGVQTEGDAVRAWNEITKYITDPGVVRKQLERVKELNALAAQQRLQRINIRRARNGYGEFDPAEIGYGGGTQPVGEAAPDDFSDVDALLGLK